MIVPMMKYDFVLHNTELADFLEKLQELGIVDTRRSNKPVDEHSTKLLEEIARYHLAFKQLAKIKIEHPETANRSYTAEHILQRTEELLEEKEQTMLRKAKLLVDVELARPWQTWRRTSLEQLERLHLKPHFYVVPEKKYNPEWEQEYPMAILNTTKDSRYFVVLEQDGVLFDFPLHEVKYPSTSVELLEAELENVEQHLNTIHQKLEKYALLKEQLSARRAELTAQLDLYLAGKGTEPAVEDILVVVTAFVPQPQQRVLDEFLEKESVVYITEAATIDDNPPVQLKNNRFARLFEPIGDMYMPPLYNELDVTAYFSPFYMLFFGFCLGDLGYGLVLILAGAIAKWRMPKMKSVFSMVQFLGLGSVIMPLVSGTFFGMKLGELFHIEGMFFDDLQMFWFALGLGGFQIIFAKLIHAFDSMKRNGFQHGLAPLGWALLLIDAALWIGRSIIHLPIPSLLITVLLYLSIALILFFTSLSKNVFTRLGKGLVSFYDITGVFGDLLSYIRLFGLGTAGGILGFVVNTVGLMVWSVPYVGYVLGGIVFVVGHIAVLGLSSLGAFVHPMRLTFVEFYKNVGFTGGGRIYKPLKKQQ